MGKRLSSTIKWVGNIIFVVGFGGFGLSAQAWDQHHYITAKAIEPLQPFLPKTIPIRSLEQFLAKAFPGCDQKAFFDRVMKGVGPRYQVFYVDQVNYDLSWQGDLYDVDTHLSPVSILTNAIGNVITPPQTAAASVLATYSDEPDWLMDVDVATYKLKKLKIEGTGSSVFRHFWFGDEGPVHFELDTPQHTERIFKLAMAAFAAGEPYWGFRFLAQATHYVQDVTQPFHAQAIPSYAMVRKLEFLRAFVNEYMRGVNAKRAAKGLPPIFRIKETVNRLPIETATLLSGMAITAYHSIYEGFARALMQKNSQPLIASTNSDFFEEPLKINFSFNNYQSSIAQFIMDAAEQTRKASKELGANMVKIWGTKYKNAEGIVEVYKTTFSDENPGARLAMGNWEVPQNRQAAVQKVYGLTSDLLDNSVQTTRLFILHALETPEAAQQSYLKELQQICLGTSLP